MNTVRISKNFKVNGMLFHMWFNTVFRPLHLKLFPNTIVGENFEKFIELLPMWAGKEHINLHEFCGHVSIILNETGGTFKPLREFGGASYCFNTVMPGGGTKYSYNRAPNKLAGNQLKEWEVITSDADVAIWNGQVYPISAPQNVQTASLKCDYYRFRGWGFNQLTWRNAYEQCLQPHLPKKIDEYGYDEFEELLKDNYELAAKTFYSYCTSSPIAQHALDSLEKGVYVHYGNLVTGNWTWYVQNSFMPRCKALYYALSIANIEDVERYAIDDMNLLPYQIKAMQYCMVQTGGEAIKAKMQKSGGADGFWGDVTQDCFEQMNMTIAELLEKAT